MDTLILAARLLLSLVFGVSGFAKLANVAGFRKSLREFGVPDSLTAFLGVLLALAEITVAAA